MAIDTKRLDKIAKAIKDEYASGGRGRPFVP